MMLNGAYSLEETAMNQFSVFSDSVIVNGGVSM